MNRISYFENILEQCKTALKQEPELIPLEWVIDQLQYLIDLEKGCASDQSRLSKIKIGRIATREMDGYADKNLLHSLCVIAKEVEKMLLERRLSNDTAKK